MSLDYYNQQRQEFESLIAQHIDLKRWGFQKAYEERTTIIYDSEWCRIRLFNGFFTMWGELEESRIEYGRLDAPNEGIKKVVNGREYRCWHFVYYYALDFLDGSSPQEANERTSKSSKLLSDFYIAEKGKEIYNDKTTADAIKKIRLHNLIWGYYGQRIFELFNLRRSDLWDEYKQYLKEVQKIRDENSRRKGRKTDFEVHGSTLDEIC